MNAPALIGSKRRRHTLRRPSAFIERVGRERLGRELRGKWKLVRILGIGGMATVYEAHHRNGSRVAVKMLHPTLSASSALCERFLREGYVANLVGHPGIPRVLDDDVDETDGCAFLVMELIEGCTLEDRACMGYAGDAEVLKIAREVLEILAAAHAKGVVHRDLKPDNLLIDRDGRVRVLDFGIARLLDDQDTSMATTTGAPFGTPAFISPEQALGRRDLVSGATDIYSLGATLFTLATDEFVHPSEHAQELVVLAATRRARSIAPLAPHLSPDVAALIDHALRFEPKYRFRTAREMLDEVERIENARRTPSDLGSIDSVREAVSLPVRASHPRVGGFTSVLVAGALALAVGGMAFSSSLDSMRSKNAHADGGRGSRPSVTTAAPPSHPSPTPQPVVADSPAVLPVTVAPQTSHPAIGGGPKATSTPAKHAVPRKTPKKRPIDVGY
jgi:serine/threonine protein kinase